MLDPLLKQDRAEKKTGETGEKMKKNDTINQPTYYSMMPKRKQKKKLIVLLNYIAKKMK